MFYFITFKEPLWLVVTFWWWSVKSYKMTFSILFFNVILRINPIFRNFSDFIKAILCQEFSGIKEFLDCDLRNLRCHTNLSLFPTKSKSTQTNRYIERENKLQIYLVSIRGILCWIRQKKFFFSLILNGVYKKNKINAVKIKFW